MRNDHNDENQYPSGPSGPSVDLLEQMGYETRDIALNTLAKWLVFLFIFIGGTTLLTGILYTWFVPRPVELEHNSALAHVRNFPPYPQIQPEPRRDIMEYRQAEQTIIDGKAASASNKSLSIEQAIDVMATQRGVAGLKGAEAPRESGAYPGSGNYAAPNAPAADQGVGYDVTNPRTSANGLTEGEPVQQGAEAARGSRRQGTEPTHEAQ